MTMKNTKLTIVAMTATKVDGPNVKSVYWCERCCITRMGTSSQLVKCPVCKKDMESIGNIETPVKNIPDYVSE